jgi:hypothetical protein
MTKSRTARRIAPSLVLALLVAWATCTNAAEEAAADVHVLPKANKHYLVDGNTLTFTELEERLAAEKPARLIIEQSRQRQGVACMVMLSIKLGIPLWTRTLNGRMHKVGIDIDSTKIDTIDSCR